MIYFVKFDKSTPEGTGIMDFVNENNERKTSICLMQRGGEREGHTNIYCP